MKNVFKEYEDILIRQRMENSTQENVKSNINTFGFIGNLLDLYLPKVGSVIVSINGQSSQKVKTKQ